MTAKQALKHRRRYFGFDAIECGVCRRIPRRLRQFGNRGFTLMEIITVLIVISIITAFAIGRGDSEGVKLKVRSEVFKTHLRHAQLQAMTAGDYWGIATNAGGTQYWMFHYDGSTTSQITLPGEESVTVDLTEENVAIVPAGIYSFDDRGKPYFAGPAATPPGNELTSDKLVELQASAGSKTPLQITYHTGFIE